MCMEEALVRECKRNGYIGFQFDSCLKLFDGLPPDGAESDDLLHLFCHPTCRTCGLRSAAKLTLS